MNMMFKTHCNLHCRVEKIIITYDKGRFQAILLQLENDIHGIKFMRSRKYTICVAPLLAKPDHNIIKHPVTPKGVKKTVLYFRKLC